MGLMSLIQLHSCLRPNKEESDLRCLHSSRLVTWHWYHENNLLLWAWLGQKGPEEGDSKTSFQFGGLGADTTVLT